MHLWRNMNNAYCQTAMGWNDDSAFDGLYESIPAWIGFMESHDEERAAYKQTQWGDEALKTDLTTRMRQLEVNASFFFTVPGPKMIWQFGEMGYDVSIEENGRTGKKPLHWEYLENKDRKALHDSYSRLIKSRIIYQHQPILMGSRYKQLGTRKIHHFIFHNQAHVSCRKLQQDRWSIYRYFPRYRQMV